MYNIWFMFFIISFMGWYRGHVTKRHLSSFTFKGLSTSLGPHCSRPEGTQCLLFLVDVLLKPEVRIQTCPFLMYRCWPWGRIFKITTASFSIMVWVCRDWAIGTRPEHCVLGQQRLCFRTSLWVYPLPTATQGETGAILSSHCLSNMYWPPGYVLGTTEEDKGSSFLHTLPSLPPAAFWVSRENQTSFI